MQTVSLSHSSKTKPFQSQSFHQRFSALQQDSYAMSTPAPTFGKTTLLQKMLFPALGSLLFLLGCASTPPENTLSRQVYDQVATIELENSKTAPILDDIARIAYQYKQQHPELKYLGTYRIEVSRSSSAESVYGSALSGARTMALQHGFHTDDANLIAIPILISADVDSGSGDNKTEDGNIQIFFEAYGKTELSDSEEDDCAEGDFVNENKDLRNVRGEMNMPLQELTQDLIRACLTQLDQHPEKFVGEND